MGLFGAGDPPCPAGSICSGQARTFVGAKKVKVLENIPGSQGSQREVVKTKGGTGIYHATATTITQGSGTEISGSETVVYIIKDNKWQPAAITKDGGKTYTFSDPKYPGMNDVAGAALKNDLKSTKRSDIQKNIDAGIQKKVDKETTIKPTEKGNIIDSAKNNAITPPEAGDTSTPSDKLDNIRENSGTRNSFGDFNYPITRDPTQDVIKFDMLKYEKRQVEGATFKDRSSLDKRKGIGSVMLPIPGGISDSNSCGWGDDTMDPLKLAAASTALAALGQNDADGGLKGALGDVFSQVKSNNESIKKAIGTSFAAQAVGADANALMSRVGGMVMNPNLELLFQGPSLRPFSFQFKMSPRSADEAEMILKIIRFFKQGMAPIRDESKLFLRTPHTFRIKYIQMGADSDRSKFLNEFKECALTGCSVQYTPEGNYAPYRDGAMSSYQMTLQFKELTPIYNDDYDKDGSNSGTLPAAIGF